MELGEDNTGVYIVMGVLFLIWAIRFYIEKMIMHEIEEALRRRGLWDIKNNTK